MKSYRTRSCFFASLLIAGLLSGIFLNTTITRAAEKEIKTLAILPFETISSDDISYVKTGILRMLHSRMAWKNRVDVISQRQVDEYLTSLKTTDKNQQIKKIAELTRADYLLAGSITQFSQAFSVDTQIYDIQNKRYLTFSEQSKDISDLVPKVNLIAARINKTVFDRQTLAYEKLVKEEKERIERWKRQNPERMMPAIPKTDPGEKSSVWKFWEYL